MIDVWNGLLTLEDQKAHNTQIQSA
jgi:hypothetical protein